MRKVLFTLLTISALIASLSIAYYFVVFLPQKGKADISRLQNEILNVRRGLGSKGDVTNTDDLKSRLDNIEQSIQEQDRERQMQSDCESNGGNYGGGGVCIYPPVN